MTKKKALVYILVFIISVGLSAWYKYSVAHDPAVKFNEACKLVINTTCQQYVKEITEQQKYEEVLEIQKYRIKENEKLLKFYKSKLINKKLLKYDAIKLNDELTKNINTEDVKRDYFLLKTAEFTLMDIVVDSIAVAQIQRKEFNDTKSAIKTINNSIKLVKKNKFLTNQEKILEYLQNFLIQITEPLE